MELSDVAATLFQKPDGQPVGHLEQAEEQVDVLRQSAVAVLRDEADRVHDRSLRTWGQADLAGHRFRAPPNLRLESRPRPFELDPAGGEHAAHGGRWIAEQAEQEVLGPDVIVVEPDRLRLRLHERYPQGRPQPAEVRSTLAPTPSKSGHPTQTQEVEDGKKSDDRDGVAEGRQAHGRSSRPRLAEERRHTGRSDRHCGDQVPSPRPVHPRRIATLAARSSRDHVDRHRIDLDEPLRSLGTYKVAIKVFSGGQGQAMSYARQASVRRVDCAGGRPPGLVW